MLKFLSLGSGSSGNCYVLQSSSTTIMVDAGLSIRTLKKALKDNGITLDKIDAVFITHDHADHIKSVGHLANDHNRLIYTTETAHMGINRNYCVTSKVTEEHRRIIQKDEPLQIGNITITPFAVPHDSSDCVGYRFDTEGLTFCLITDAGEVTPVMGEAISAANYLVLESNHDVEMLKAGPYPEYLRNRILSGRGHLSNNQCGEALAKYATPNLRQVWLCHLSDENNHPVNALKTVESVLRDYGIIVGLDFKVEDLKRRTPSPFYELS